jgi:sulfite exporter TauE/SafE
MDNPFFCNYIKPKMVESLYYLFLSGLVLGSGPCLGFCAPALGSFIAVYKPSFKKAAVSYLYFSSAKIISYMMIAALAGGFSGFLRSFISSKQMIALNMFMGALVILAGILTIAANNPLENKYCLALSKGNLRNAGLLGFLGGFAPCLPLIGILDYIIMISNSAQQAAFLALIFGLGTAISPAFLIIVFSGKVSRLLSGSRKAKFWVRIISSLLLIFLGLKALSQGASFYQLTR